MCFGKLLILRKLKVKRTDFWDTFYTTAIYKCGYILICILYCVHLSGLKQTSKYILIKF